MVNSELPPDGGQPGTGDPAPAEEGGEGTQGLPDISELSFADLANMEDSTLRQVLERIMKELDDPDGVISAFSSFTE